MARYRIALRLSEPLPGELIQKKLSFREKEVTVTARQSPPTLEIEPVEGADRNSAHLEARRALNNLLNYFAANAQFQGILVIRFAPLRR